MASLEEVLKKLKQKARPDQLEGMARYGIVAERRLGVSIPDMRKIAKETGNDHELALNLWKTGIPDAMIVAALVDEPDKLTEDQMEDWVKDLNSWDVCDQLCMNLFERTPLVWKKIFDWSVRDEQFVKRAAYALIACLAWHDKRSDEERFLELIPVIQRGATDGRNYVKKAVNWALRNIGKRSLRLNRAALEIAQEMRKLDSRAARWIATDAIRELESDAVQRRLKKKES
jgi:3-methyladenine DNA glycosylase AlkD